MAIETSKRHKRSKFGKSATRAAGKMNTIRVLIVLLVIIPIAFLVIKPQQRDSFIGYQLGQGYEKLGNFDVAAAKYEWAYTASGKTNKLAQLKHSRMLNNLKKHTEALRVSSLMETENAGNELLLSDILLETGRANEGLGDIDDAMAAYHNSIKMNSRNYDALVCLGRTFRLKGDYRSSRQYLEDAVDLHNLRAPEAHYEMGLTYIAENNNQDAIEEFDLVLSQLPGRELREKAAAKKIEVMGR